MKHVTFTRDMKPYRAGDKRLVPDHVADELTLAGAIAPEPPDFPAQSEQRPREQRPRRAYQTKAQNG